MVQRMLIDATHPEETRVAVVSGTRLEEFDHETASKQHLKGNIYLAKVTRVEPSLQAAFIDYSGNRHGFLAFGEIHPDYYRIPVADREALDHELRASAPVAEEEEEGSVEENAALETAEEAPRFPPRNRYKIQEVIKRNQILLVQVVKEERGGKGAAVTTYLSLAGRYCVLMPNTTRNGGVSRKIVDADDRKRLREILNELPLPDSMAVILRTAGAGRTKTEIKRDFDYLIKLWDHIRITTLEAAAPSLIHEEAVLIKRAIRDMYAKDTEEILVAGDEAYRSAKDFMKSLIPSHARKVKAYRSEAGASLFQSYNVESQLAAIHDPVTRLPSGGSVVIHQTEALVAIDVNSGRAIRERNIEETALKTNLEAASEVARQLRLRDMAGLIVIDFIDMEDARNNAAVERRLKEALKKDRARIQIGRISSFGLLEMSRQRLRPSLLESMTRPCAHCGGTGYIQSTESAALMVLRAIEDIGLKQQRAALVTVTLNSDIALYLFNNKRQALADSERRYGFVVEVKIDPSSTPTQVAIVASGVLDDDKIKPMAPIAPALVAEEEDDDFDPADAVVSDEPEAKVGAVNDDVAAEGAESGEDARPKRRRRRRGRKPRTGDEATPIPQTAEALVPVAAAHGSTESLPNAVVETVVEAVADAVGDAAGAETPPAAAPRRRTRSRRRSGARALPRSDAGAGRLDAEAFSTAEGSTAEAAAIATVPSRAPVFYVAAEVAGGAMALQDSSDATVTPTPVAAPVASSLPAEKVTETVEKATATLPPQADAPSPSAASESEAAATRAPERRRGWWSRTTTSE